MTPAEKANARRGIRALRDLYGTSAKLAVDLGVSRTTVANAAGNKGLSAELALRVAHLAGVSVSDLLTGQWPAPRTCYACGQPVTT